LPAIALALVTGFIQVQPAAAASPSSAGAPSSPVSAAPGSTVIAMSDAECAMMAKTAGMSVAAFRASGGCQIALSVTVGPKPAATRVSTPSTQAVGPMAPAPACVVTTIWFNVDVYVNGQSFPFGLAWSETAHAIADMNNCGYVKWKSVTMSGSAHGFSINIDWKGAYPSLMTTYYYADSNFGANFTVSAIYQGFPISAQHGIRSSFNPMTWQPYGVQGW
jgi:hypothetical protein